MSKPIESTPALDDEEWSVFLKVIERTEKKPFKMHEVNLEEIRRIEKEVKDKRS